MSKQTDNYKADGKTLKGKPKAGYQRVTNIMSGKQVDEAIGTPFTCSVQSESYWCS